MTNFLTKKHDILNTLDEDTTADRPTGRLHTLVRTGLSVYVRTGLSVYAGLHLLRSLLYTL